MAYVLPVMNYLTDVVLFINHYGAVLFLILREANTNYLISSCHTIYLIKTKIILNNFSFPNGRAMHNKLN